MCCESIFSRSWYGFGFCCCSVTKSYPVLCHPMDCSTPGFGFPFLHHSQSLLRLRSIESVTPFNHLILCCFFFRLSTNIPSNVSLISSSNQVAKVSELQHRSFQWILLAIVQVTFCSRLFISKSQDLNSIHCKKHLVEISYVYSKGLRNA